MSNEWEDIPDGAFVGIAIVAAAWAAYQSAAKSRDNIYDNSKQFIEIWKRLVVESIDYGIELAKKDIQPKIGDGTVDSNSNQIITGNIE